MGIIEPKTVIIILFLGLFASAPLLANSTTCVDFFYSPLCEHCHRMNMTLGGMREGLEIEIRYHDMLNRSEVELRESFDEFHGVPFSARGGTPAIFVGGEYAIGEKTQSQMEDLLDKNKGARCREFDAEGVGRSIALRFMQFSFVNVLFAAAIDSINPCAIAGILFFISYLLMTKRGGVGILAVGATYSLGIYIAYLLLGIGFMGILDLVSRFSIISRLIYPVSAFIALALAILSFHDFLKAKEGNLKDMALQLPQWAKKLTRKGSRQLSTLPFISLSAFFVGFFISLFEFLCTGQVYLPTIVYILGVPELRNEALLYLFLYNAVFVMPVVLIFLAAYLGVSSKALNSYFEKNVALVKLLTAAFFVVMALFLFAISFVR